MATHDPTTQLREALTIARDALDVPGGGCPDYSEHGPDEAWHCEGCLEAKAAEDAVAAIDAALAAVPALAAELTEAQRLAEGIICELVSEAEFDDIGDRLEDHAEGLAAIDFDQLRRNVADLISKATVTVTWPQDAEQAGDA